MASSGSFNTSSYGSGNYNRYLNFSWSVQSQSVANNSTTISYTLKGAGGSTSSWQMSGNFKLIIDGQTVYSSATRIQLKNGTVVKSGTFTMTHDSAGKRSFSAYAEAGINLVAVNCTGSGSWSLPTIARAATITSAPNFNDTANPTIQYSNPAGNNVTTLQACIASTDAQTIYVPYRDISKTGSSYTFNLTDAERNALRAATPNSNTLNLKFYILTVIGGTTLYNSVQKTMTIVDGNPTFSASYKDTNSTTTGITGSNQQIIRNQSTLQVNATSLSAKKSATIKTVTCALNGTTYNGTISGTSCTFNIGKLNIASDSTATVIVTDSRGNSASKNLNIQILDWVLPTAIVTMQRENNFYSNTTINVDASISSVNNKNTMTIKLRYKKTSDSTWSDYTVMSDNDPQDFTLDNNYQWDVQVVIMDLFGNTTYNLTLSRGMPIVFFDRLKSSVGFNCFPKYEKSVEVNGVPMQKSIMTRSLSAALSSLSALSYTKVNLNLTNSVGDLLTATNDGGIKIGAGVSKVMVSGAISYNAVQSDGNRHFRIVKNSNSDDNTLGWNYTYMVQGDPTGNVIPPVLVDVEEDDVIYMLYYTPNSGDTIGGNAYGGRTSLTVEVVG